MGLKYIFFRLFFNIKTKVGWQKIVFPTNPSKIYFIEVSKWRKDLPPFFFYGKNINGLKRKKDKLLESNFNEISRGIFTFFNKIKINLGNDYDWLTNPLTSFKYDIKKHWSETNDFSLKSGDIKYVWEKSRFTFLYDVILYDYNFQDDQSEFVFNQIKDFIKKNPINQGPNYKCSQEISLRILNWVFAIYFYKDSPVLKDDLFQMILNSIYWQIHHVYSNINFSRISVRNNHAVAETLLLYLSGKLFPFFPNVKKWSKKGKVWFEQEIEYQIYSDGTYLQSSMNYHRVVIQLMTWAIQLSKLNNDSFKPVVYKKAEKSLKFLKSCLDPVSGKLPNYGPNDGALFFKLNNDDYRNYKSQLDDLNIILKGYTNYNSESHYWYGIKMANQKKYKIQNINKYTEGGYYIVQEDNTKTFIRCAAYKDRPYQSDNLHLDIWVDGKNILRDNGSYRYNCSEELVNYFNGSEGHNTISIDYKNQMQKGKRFIWNYWVKVANATLNENKNSYVFKGKIKGFKTLGSNIFHKRKVIKSKGINEWLIEDKIEGIEKKTSFQYWHISKETFDKIKFTCFDENEVELKPIVEEKWYSSYYGVKEKSLRVSFKSQTNRFLTKIVYNK